MAIKPCGECGGPVSNKAAICQRCGAAQPKQTSILTWFCVFLLGLAALIWIYAGADTYKSVPDSQVESDPKTQVKDEKQITEKTDSSHIPSSIGVVDVAVCAAAAMKAGQGIELFTPWADTLKSRYAKIYPDKTQDELDRYTIERILDKRRYLESNGIGTSAGFYKFYKQNCEF